MTGFFTPADTDTDTVRVRFAPSPTGQLHLGNARIAVMNALFARAHGGELILRMDDTDIARSTEVYAQGIRDDLTWLGIDWVREEKQSDRTARYQDAMAFLRESGRLYACYETPEELDSQRRRQRARGLPPVYNRAALQLTDEEKAALEAAGRTPHWRFFLKHEDIAWDDLSRGACHYNGAHLSDPVLVREDGALLYTLPSVVDDLDFGITHVIRGEDHVANTAVQIQLIQALNGQAPRFAHLPLVVTASGEPLSKRDGSGSLAALRADGIEPAAIIALMATLGSGEAADPLKSADEIAAHFRLDAFGRSSPRLDENDLERLSAQVLHALDYEQARDRGVDLSAEVWDVVRPNLTRLSDVETWSRVINGVIDPNIAPEDRDFIAQAAASLPPAPWDEATWSGWTTALKTETGRKGKALFLPLRRALTGLDHGPDMTHLLPLIGFERARLRLEGEPA